MICLVESGANKFVNSDWKRENYNGRFQGNEVNRKHNHTKSNNVIDNRRPRSKGVVSKYQKDEVYIRFTNACSTRIFIGNA